MKIQKRLGELVLRTENLDEMIRFYTDVIQLEIFRKVTSVCFLKIADDFEGHPQLLALFDSGIPSNGPDEPAYEGIIYERSNLHHFAFAIESGAFENQRQYLINRDLKFRYTEHFPMKWKSLYIYDPDGNTVEFVCYDAGLVDPSGS